MKIQKMRYQKYWNKNRKFKIGYWGIRDLKDLNKFIRIKSKNENHMCEIHPEAQTNEKNLETLWKKTEKQKLNWTRWDCMLKIRKQTNLVAKFWKDGPIIIV